MHTPRIEYKNNVLSVYFDDVKPGWEQWVQLTGDRHHDNKYCRRDIEERHLELAKERGALIVDVGDAFCAMQGKYDPRSDMSQIRPEDVSVNYLDTIVNHAIEFYSPYAKHFLLLGRGNHDQNILNRHGTDLISNLVHGINTNGGNCRAGGYGGWIRMEFIRSGHYQRFNIKYHHGSAGGNSPVTRGVIQTNRQAVYLPDADAVVNGHTHDSYYVPIARERITHMGDISRDIVHFIRTATYKDEYRDGSTGWAVEKGHAPKPLGCAWIHFVYDSHRDCDYVKASVILDIE